MQASNKVDLGLVKQLSQCTAEIQRLKMLVADKDRTIAERDARIRSLEGSNPQRQSGDTHASMPPPMTPNGKGPQLEGKEPSPVDGKADKTPLHTATGLNPFILHLMQSPSANARDGGELRESSTTSSGLAGSPAQKPGKGYTPATKGDVLATLDDLETNNSAIRRRSLQRMIEGGTGNQKLNPSKYCEPRTFRHTPIYNTFLA
jgi:hypothetical protein